jgi:hypothetical protein
MFGAEYFDGIMVDAALLDFDVAAHNTSLKNRTKAILNSFSIPAGSGSIVGRPGDNYLEVSQDGSNLVIEPGYAIDINGEWIDIPYDPTEHVDPYEPDKPSRIYPVVGSDDDYYFGVEYAEASGCIKTNREGESFYVRYYDSYAWVNSTSPLTSGSITLATYTISGGIITALTDVRTNQWLSCQADAANVYILNTPLTGMDTLQDHVNMLGTATPTAANPHGVFLQNEFDDLTHTPTGLVGGAQHGSDAHDDTVPVVRTSSYTRSDSTLQPVAEGGGSVWVDGYFTNGSVPAGGIELDDLVDWRYRWITVTGYIYEATDADDYTPGGAHADNISGYIDPSTPATVNNLAFGHFYSDTGGAGTVDPRILIKFNGGSTMKLWVDTTGVLKADIDTWRASPTGFVFSFGLVVEYGPRRKTV